MNISKSLERVNVPEIALASEKARVVGLQNQACNRCGKTWWPRSTSKPKRCPCCKTPYWDQPRREKNQTPKNWEAMKKEIQDKLYRKLGINVVEEQPQDRSLAKALAVLEEMRTDGRTWQQKRYSLVPHCRHAKRWLQFGEYAGGVQKRSKSQKLYRIMKQVMQAFEEIAASIHSATISEFPEIVGELERLRTLIQLRMLNGSAALSPISQSVSPDGGQYLSVEQVAQRFHVTPKWLYRHKKQLPHSQPSRKLLLFPERAITNWFANRRRS